MHPLNRASLCLFLGALALFVFGLMNNNRRATLPVLSERLSPDGVPETSCDDALVRDSFAQMGLPQPPAFDGTDPVPTQEVLKRVRAWQESGSPELLGELGMMFFALGEDPVAITYLAAARADDPSNPWWHYFLGAACQRQGHRAKAIELFGDFQTRARPYPPLFARLGQLHLELKNYVKALTYYERYRELEPTQSLAYIGLGRVLLAQDQPEAALEKLQKAVALANNDFMAYRFLGRALLATGAKEAAIEATRKAESLPQYNGWLMFDPKLGQAFKMARSQTYLSNELKKAFGNNEMERAQILVDELIRRRPKDLELVYSKVNIYLKQNNPAPALPIIEKALLLAPDDLTLLLNKARALFMNMNIAAAEAEVDRLYRLDPNNAAVFELKARCLFQRGQRPQALRFMQKAVVLDQDNLGFQFVLGVMCMESGLKDEARTCFEGILKQAPNHAGAKAQLARLDALK